jgi:hypothetical protein
VARYLGVFYNILEHVLKATSIEESKTRSNLEPIESEKLNLWFL